MSAAIASRRRPSRIASAMYGSSSTINTRMLSHAASRHISSAYRKTDTCWQHDAALTGGHDLQRSSTNRRPAPGKAMTAYIVLKHYPLSGAQDGFTITFTEAQVEAQDQSVAAVRGGEQRTEGELLEALRFPSANNIGQA